MAGVALVKPVYHGGTVSVAAAPANRDYTSSANKIAPHDAPGGATAVAATTNSGNGSGTGGNEFCRCDNR